MRAMLKIRNVLVFFILFMVLWGFSYVNAETKKEVVIYTSLDQIFSEPILKEFEQEFSIRVKVVYDTEAAKTTGLVNRLIAEKDNPCADVFWNNEIARTIVLKEMGILTPHVSPNSDDIPAQFKDKDGFWTGFAARARVLIFNTNLVNEKDAPQSIFDLTNPKWKGKFCLANPLFGTTAPHAASLFVKLGDKEAEKFFKDLNEN